jgi:hypothetical protein
VEVPVEHDRRRPTGLAGGPLEHGIKGLRVAVEAADDIEGVGRQLCRLGEGLGLIAIGQRAAASTKIQRFLPSPGTVA